MPLIENNGVENLATTILYTTGTTAIISYILLARLVVFFFIASLLTKGCDKKKYPPINTSKLRNVCDFSALLKGFTVFSRIY